MAYMPKIDSHKGENGKILIVGGSPRYHGSALFAIEGAKRFADIVYFMPAKPCPYLIQAVKNIPEVIVIASLDDVEKLGVDAILYGPGSDGAGLLKEIVKMGKKTVIDGDGLKEIREVSKELLANSIITPHEGEFKMLSGKVGSEENVKELANELGCVVVKKGKQDIISNGKEVLFNDYGNPGLTKGGSGDMLAGLITALFAKMEAMEASKEGVELLTRTADKLVFKKGFYYTMEEVANKLAENAVEMWWNER
ncbi:MAG: NAD(P)H-hydrate dehydratase [Methanobacteriota archaeon]|nr:MAG: NAD(P)H-hydrate dehydratase [Euryarchaeota archaeon]